MPETHQLAYPIQAEHIPPPHSRSNLLRLTLAQALAGANSVVVYAIGAIVGNMLAPSKALATLPISVFVVGMALCSLPVGRIAEHFGRKTAFMCGTGCGVLTGLLAALAVVYGSFWLYCFATLLGGAYAAVVLSFRFAAADCVHPAKRPHALSLVMAGGIAAGVIGPQLVTHTMQLWGYYPFAATFVAQAGIAAISALILQGVRLPAIHQVHSNSGRPISKIARQPAFLIAACCGVVSYLLMNFLMTAAPLAMYLCGLSQESANLGIEWHVIAMYTPSFFTGRLISRFGARRIVLLGLLLIAAAVIAGLQGLAEVHFWTTLVLLGLGWNFGFIGASALVLQCHLPEEKARVQSFNDFVVFGMVAMGSFLSGGLLSAFGWHTVLWLSFIPLMLATLVLILAPARMPERPAMKG